MENQIGSEKQNAALKQILAKERASLGPVELALIANRVRQNIVDMVYRANSGHPGGSLGLADIQTVLYFKFLRERNSGRDRFVLSNGHVCPVRYAVMAQAGVIPEELLNTFRQLGSKLQGHPSTRYLPEVENSSGSLGQGMSVACGMALGLRQQKDDSMVFLGISDGECQEGMTWEGAMSAAHYKLDNLAAYIDWNNIQIDGKVTEVMDVGSLADKFAAFGWLTRQADGHNIEEIEAAFDWARQREGKPKIIVFKTVLGKDVSFMENNPAWHGSPPDQEKHAQALQELKAIADQLLVKLA